MKEINLECAQFRECVGSSNICNHQYEISSMDANLDMETPESYPEYSVWHNNSWRLFADIFCMCL